MATNSELIHAGLPWTNPQKVTIKSDEYVSDMTVNRGFLNLLNNDYYLDLKTEAINNYIERAIDTHIDDESIHFPLSKISDLINKLVGLSENSVCYIPIYEDQSIYDISQIKIIINNVSKNLNGYTLLFTFVIPASQVLDAVVGDNTITLQNYKNYLKLSASDITNNSKFGPKDISSSSKFTSVTTLNLNHYNLSFENYQSGNLIIYGNNLYFIDDLREDGTINTDVYTELKTGYDMAILLRYIQNDLLNIARPVSTDDNKLITIIGNGINLNHSVISTKNCTSQTYIYNLKIENNCSSNEIIDFNDYEFPEQQNIIGYWPLLENYEPQILNTKYLNQSDKFILNSQNVSLGVSGDYLGEDAEIAEQYISPLILAASAQIMNINTQTMINPGLMWFDKHFILDKDISEKGQSNQIKNIIYNTKGSTPHTSLVFWGYQNITDTGNNPIIGDYNVDTGNGLYIAPDVVKSSDKNNVSTENRESCGTDYYRYSSNMLKNWVMYVVEFQNSGGILTDTMKSMEPWKNEEWQEDLLNNQIRVNIRAVFTSKIDNSINSVLLLPTEDDIQSNTLNNLSKPTIDPQSNVSLFGIKQFNINSSNNMNGWSVWNGAVRNVILIDKFLSDFELLNLYKKYIPRYYPWLDDNETLIIRQLTNESYFGSIYSKNMHSLSVVGCILKQHAQTLNLRYQNE